MRSQTSSKNLNFTSRIIPGRKKHILLLGFIISINMEFDFVKTYQNLNTYQEKTNTTYWIKYSLN